MERGDIWFVDLNPVKGREQANARYVLIVTPKAFNQLGVPIIVPITAGGEFARFHGLTVSLSGAGTNAVGVVLCHRIRALDVKARGGRFSEKAPDFIVGEVLAKVAAFFE
jgi:mRNA-degrading endonuclease toxin of MazEF toxin-antitoxin module